MADSSPPPPQPAASSAVAHDLPAWRLALGITLGLTLLRLAALRASPLELYPDEAQYWVWSRELAFGYFSKPPLIAWIIWLTTHALGDAEPFVRLSSPLLHAVAGLFIFAAGRKLYGAWTGVLGLALYELCGAVQLGAFIVSTDTPLCACLSAALWLYALLQAAEGRSRLLAAAGFGLALGLAFLAKYAAIYAVIGVGVHLVLSPATRRAWTWADAELAVLAFALAAGPNLAWNAAHGFSTIAATAGEAAWENKRAHFTFAGLATFLAGQLAVFGPAPFLILVGGGCVLAWRRGLVPADLLLLAWTLPPLVIIAAEAFIARAQINWAAAAYVPGSVLVAAWLIRWRARRWIAIIVAGQALIAAGVVVVLVDPALADRLGGGKALKGLRGWRELTQIIEQRAALEQLAGPVSAVAVDSRYLYDEGAYYGRDYFGADGPPLRVWLSGHAPRNEAERSAPLTAAFGRRVVAASFEGAETPAMMQSFATARDLQINTVGLDRDNSRRLDTFVGEGFRPAG